MTDLNLLLRIVQAPWLPSRPQQRISALLRRNRDAIDMIDNENRRLTETSLSTYHIDILENSGWIDYLRTYRDIDLSSRNRAFPVTIINGQMYSTFDIGLGSVFDIKFFKIPGTIPFVFRYTPNGYHYLLPIDIRVERLEWLLRGEYKDIFDITDPEREKMADMSDSDLKDYVKKTGIDKILKDPLAQQAILLMQQGIDTYEVYFDFYVLEDLITGQQSVAAYPAIDDRMLRKYADTKTISREMADQILDVWSGDEPTGYRIISFTHHMRSLNSHVMNRVGQYILPEIKEGDGEVIWNMVNTPPFEKRKVRDRETGKVFESQDQSTYEYMDMLMCLSSRGLLDKLRESGRKDYFRFFTEHLNPSMLYARYSIMSMRKLSMRPSVYNKYQTTYNEVSRNRTSRIVSEVPEVELLPEDRRPEGREDRLLFIIGHRIATGTKALGLPDAKNCALISTSIYGEMDEEFRTSAGDYRVSKLDQRLVSRYMPTIRKMFEYRGRIYSDYKEVEQLQPVRPLSRYFTIHGITFKSEEIVRLFYNTPITNAVAISSEYDPPFMSHRDVKLTSDLLSGLIMPYAFYTQLSWTAFIALSDEGTFLYLYGGRLHDQSYILDNAFILGERLINYLSEFKHFEGYEGLNNKTKTLLTLF